MLVLIITQLMYIFGIGVHTLKNICLIILFCFYHMTLVHAHELGIFGKSRPNISEAADAKVREFRNTVTGESKDQLEKDMRKRCPKEYALIDRIFSRIRNASPVDVFLKATYAPTIICWCDSKNDKSGMGTGTRLDGELQIAGSYIGKANSEDSIAFVFAHELSHFLYAHDEETTQEIIDQSKIPLIYGGAGSSYQRAVD